MSHPKITNTRVFFITKPINKIQPPLKIDQRQVINNLCRYIRCMYDITCTNLKMGVMVWRGAWMEQYYG